VKESAIEAYLRDQVKAQGGKAYKFISPGNAGVPDRLVLLPGGKIAFVELKTPGKKSTALQAAQQRRIRSLGFDVFADVDSRNLVDALLREVISK